MDSITLSADLTMRPEDLSAGAFVLPTVQGVYSDKLHESAISRLEYAVTISIQPPALAPVTQADAAKRLLLSGGDGSLSLGLQFRVGSIEKKRLLVLGLYGHGAWASPKSKTDVSSYISNTFGMVAGRGNIAAVLGPFYLAAQYQLAQSFGAKSDDAIAALIQANNSLIGLAALKLNFQSSSGQKSTDYYLQGRLLKTFNVAPDTVDSGITFDIRFVSTFMPL